MTYKAEVRRIGPELILVSGLMRIMAEGAVAVFYGLVDRFLGIDLVMALVAQVGRSLYRSKFVLSLGLVACAAVADSNGAVDELVLSHCAVALVGDAGLRRAGNVGMRQSANEKNKKKNRDRNRRSPHHILLPHVSGTGSSKFAAPLDARRNFKVSSNSLSMASSDKGEGRPVSDYKPPFMVYF